MSNPAIPAFQPHSGSQPASATGGTRQHPARTQPPLPPEPSRSVPSAPREGSFAWDEVVIWLSIFAVGAASLVWMAIIAAVMLAIFTAPLWIVGLLIWLAVR